MDTPKAFLILYLWGMKTKMMAMETMTGVSRKSIKQVLGDLYHALEESLPEEALQIGGIDNDGNPIIVEIDESKFGKRKHNRGHRVEGVWVLGGVERTAERKVFLTTVENRNAETLKAIITRFVKPGSMIHTDGWRGYATIPEWEGYSYQHRVANHRLNFVTEDGIHTNTIEDTWNGIKMNVSARQRTASGIPWKLVEFVWRRWHKDNIWDGMWESLGSLSFGAQLEDSDIGYVSRVAQHQVLSDEEESPRPTAGRRQESIVISSDSS